MPRTSHNSTEAADLDTPIYGVKQISAVVGLTERQTFHALESGYLPATKFGRKWASTRRRLRDRFNGEA